jgi:RNA polymerase sigma-70 factor, ECF subfamily
MQELPPDYREVLLLREVEELSYREIAKVVGVPIGRFRQILRRLQGQAFFRCAAHDEAITPRAIRLA